MRKTNKLMAGVLMALISVAGINAQTPYSCDGCVDLAERDTVYLSSLADANGNLTAGHTLLTCNNLYILDRKIYVSAGDTLTILPGVVVKATYNGELNSTALIVTRDAKIFAEGSECCPIIFTTVEDPLDGTFPIYTKERWGGIIILGRAHNTIAINELNPEAPEFTIGATTAGVGFIEGVDAGDPRHYYGSEIDLGEPFNNEDNSGTLRYVSIRHGGSELGTANEINGLTLGSVGSGTTLEYIEVVSNGDDGIEFFGGAANVKHVRVLYCEDDYIDYDQGFTGKIQYVLGVQRPAAAPGATALGDNGFECDGDDGDDFVRLWLSDPTISNATIIGNDGPSSGDNALELKERTKGKIYNSIFVKFNKGINLANPSEDTVIIRNCTFVNMNTDISGTFVTGFDPSQASWNNSFVDSVAGMTANVWDEIWDALPTVTGSAYDVNADDDWFDAVNYRGAYKPGTSNPWWGMKYCPGVSSVRADAGENLSSYFAITDLNGDGITNAADLGILIGNYGLRNDEL